MLTVEQKREVFINIIAQIEEFNEEAAEYLRGLMSQNLSREEFSPCELLGASIVFRDTPQGYKYWYDIADRIENV